MWFEKLTGFKETREGVMECLEVANGVMTSKVNGKRYQCGWLETPSLGDLRRRNELEMKGKISLRLLVKDLIQAGRALLWP